MKIKVVSIFSAAVLLMTSQLAYARATIDPSASVAYLLTQAAVQPVSAPNASSDTATFNRTFQDASLSSSNGEYTLIGQKDGNLVIWGRYSQIWASNTSIGPGSYNFIFQDDGNLVIYNSNKAIWASNSNGKGGNRLVMQNDGNLVIYGPCGAVWASNSYNVKFGAGNDGSCQPDAPSNTATFNRTFQDAPLISSNGQYKLIGQSDGNLVIYNITPSGESPIWASNTNNGPGSYNFIFQDDGNLVIYKSNKAIWASNSNGKGGNRIVMEDNGFLVIYETCGAVWDNRYGPVYPDRSECEAVQQQMKAAGN